MDFLIEDGDLLKKLNNIWNKVSADIKEEPVYNKEFTKIKIKSHGDQVTGFYNKEIPKVGSNNTCLAVISLDSTLKKEDNCYWPLFLKECKYFRRKAIEHIHDILSGFSYSSDESDSSDEE